MPWSLSLSLSLCRRSREREAKAFLWIEEAVWFSVSLWAKSTNRRICRSRSSVAPWISLVTWFQDGQSEYIFCQECLASEWVITEQSPEDEQTEQSNPPREVEEETGPPCAPCAVAREIERTYKTATKFVVITEDNMRDEIVAGSHMAYTMSTCGFIYWHEFFVKEVDWSEKTVMVYEKTKKGRRGMHLNKMKIKDILKEQLCRKFIYDECLPFDKSVELAESMVGDGKYHPACDNCEHSARYLKTGRKESIQVRNACFCVLQLLCSHLPKVLRGPAVRSLAFTLAEIIAGELYEQLVHHAGTLLFGAETIASLVVFLIIYLFKVNKLKKQLEKNEISQDNFEDLRTIVRYSLSGAALGSLIGIIVASPTGIAGIEGVALACVVGFFLSLIGSVIAKNIAFWVVRKRNNKRLSNKLIASRVA